MRTIEMPRLRRLTISESKIRNVIELARLPQPGPPSDATGTSPSPDRAHVNEMLRHHLEALDQTFQEDLLALAWFGREEASTAEWQDFHLDAQRAWTRATAAYLAAMPELSDFLEYAVAALADENPA